MNCSWKKPKRRKGRWVYTCRVCDKPPVRLLRLFEDPAQLLRTCTGELKLPSTLRRIGNFSIASVKHMLRGLPTCSQEQIDARIAEGCEQCPGGFYKDGVCHHPKCGCPMNKQQAFILAVAWKDKTCPIGAWKEVDKRFEKRGWLGWLKAGFRRQASDRRDEE